jgi:hypothetical protein
MKNNFERGLGGKTGKKEKVKRKKEKGKGKNIYEIMSIK